MRKNKIQFSTIATEKRTLCEQPRKETTAEILFSAEENSGGNDWRIVPNKLENTF